MQPQFYMYCYPWDLEDEGLEDSLARLAGEIGVDGINVAATSSEILQYRPRKPLDKRVFRTEAGAHFQPDSKKYGTARIKPQAASWMKSRNPLDRIVKACEKEKLKVRASVCCCVGRAMVKRYPFAACVNALGVQSERVLCPTHPDVRDYLTAMVEDLSLNYGLNAIELTCLRRDHSHDDSEHEVVQPGRSHAANELLSYCFCSACRQDASKSGIAPDAALESARTRLEQWLDDPAAIDFERHDLFSQELGLVDYKNSQRAGVVELLPQLKEHTHCDLTLDFPAGDFPKNAAFITSELLSRLDRVKVGALMLDDGSNGLTIENASVLDPEKLEVTISAWPSGIDDAPILVATTHRMVQRPYHTISFSDYGCAQQPLLDAIRQAIRYARREAR